MFENELKLNAMNEAYLQRLVADLPDERLAEQPHAGMNHPAWILGHLACAYDFAAQFLGHDAKLKRWYPLFAPGTTPLPDRAKYASKTVLLEKLNEVGQLTRESIPNADPESLKGPHPFDPVKPFLSTTGDMVSYILSAHLAGHLGQLSAWRRTVGLPNV